MKIGIDISQVVHKGTGVARFIEGIIDAICEYDSQNEWTFFFSSLRKSLDPTIEKQINQKGWRLVKMKIPPRALSIIWNDLHVLKLETMLGNLDWFITSDWAEPPADCKKATVVHDLVYLRYPETVDPLILKTQSKRLTWVQKESDLIFADSQATKDDLTELLKIGGNKIKVNYPGIAINQPRSEKSSKKRFILTVGKIEPRKNIGKLIEAFNRLAQSEVELLIVGPEGWGENHKPNANVRFLGFVTDDQLHNLYSSCLGFVYPSIWEGFGYPILEAMAHGAPVATSKKSSLQEIAGDAALLFDPNKTSEIQAALHKLITDAKLRKELTQKGRIRAKDFTWKKYYDVLIKSLW